MLTQLACIWEASARKPGNVHRFADFEDTHYLDFLLASAAIAPVLERAPSQPLGATVLRAVEETRRVASTNVNLGIILLLAPLAKVSADVELRCGIRRVLAELDMADARNVFEAIRLARPGGLGRAAEQDVRGEPMLPLLRIMELAAGHDLVARQYANGFREVFDQAVPALRHGIERTGALENAIIHCHLTLLAQIPDSLIERKLGKPLAEEAARRAAQVLAADWPFTGASRALLADLDAWLRADGNRRNPGTTADLVTASLYVALREGILKVPPQVPWSAGERHD